MHNLHNSTTCALFAHVLLLNWNVHFLHIAFSANTRSGIRKFCNYHHQHAKFARCSIYHLHFQGLLISHPVSHHDLHVVGALLDFLVEFVVQQGIFGVVLA